MYNKQSVSLAGCYKHISRLFFLDSYQHSNNVEYHRKKKKSRKTTKLEETKLETE